MGKKVSECCDQWNDLQTMALADKMDIDAFKPSMNNCSSLDDYELNVRNDIEGNIQSCRDEFGELDPNNTLQIMALASLNNIDVDQLVKVILGCYESQTHVLSLESRVNKLYERFVESKLVTNERETTPAHDGEVAAMDIATKFDKDDIDIDSDVDVKNKKDAWVLRLVYNDGNREDLSLVKQSDDKRDYTITSDKDKLKVNFSDEEDELNVPQSVIDHIARHIEQAEDNIEDNKKNNDSDLAKEIAFDIKKEFPKYDMEIIDGDVGSSRWSIQIVYKDGNKDSFSIMKAGKGNYLMKSKDGFIAKFTLDELKNMPKKLKEHIEQHAKKAEKK
jgi:hypothetical protein